MPNYHYKAKKENAALVQGHLQARDADEALDLLTRRGLIPVLVEEASGQDNKVAVNIRSGLVSPRDLYVVTRQMLGLLKSGIPLIQVIEVLARQTGNIALARVWDAVAVGIRNGGSFSSCLDDHQDVFPPLYIAMAKAGEESGRLRELMASMMVYFRRQAEMDSRVRSALAYPLFMLAAGVITVIVILTFVMPRISVLFNGLDAALPWPTLFVMGVSHFLTRFWPVWLGFVFLGVVFWRTFGHGAAIRRWREELFFSLPYVREFALKVNVERFSRTLGLLLGSGIPILKALKVSIPTLSGETFKKSLYQVQERVAGGAGFGAALQEAEVFPEMFARLVSVGEESGELASTLNDIADTYDQDVTEATKTFTALLEPSMILVVGLVVGFIIFAMLMPVFQMDIFSR